MEGKVKWYNRKKGFGFVLGEDGTEYFVHFTGLSKGTFIRDNDEVSFDVAETEKGKQAQNVVLLRKASEIEQGGEAPQESFGDEEPAQEEAQSEEQPEAQPEEVKQE